MPLTRHQLGRRPVHEGTSELALEADVVVVGGAVAGASMAHALAERGLSSILLERNKEYPEINRGDVIQPLSLGFLERWDVIPYIESRGGFPLYEWNFFHPRLGHLGTWDFSTLPYHINHQTILRHIEIHRALYAAMAPKSELIAPHRDAVVTGAVTDNDDQRIVGVVGTCGGKTFEARGRVVVAADGPNSRLRQFLQIGQEERYRYDHEYLMLMTPRPRVPEMDKKGVQYIGRHGLTVLIPLDGGDEVRIPVQIPLKTLPEWRHLDSQELRYRLLLRAPVLESVDTSTAVNKLTHSYAVFWRHADAYVKNNVCLIGEAAHTIHPTTAQGMNMAMLDAEVLAAVIKRAFGSRQVSDETLGLYEEARMPVNEMVMETSHHQTLHHTATGVWHDIWGARMYRWVEDDDTKRDLSLSIAGLKNPTSKDLKILDDVEQQASALAHRAAAE
jgi:2-polyprenyl-6-methoxyphenol hydroxylase-like FAD-dependent oxidoreductase